MISFTCGVQKETEQMNQRNDIETDSEIQRANRWLLGGWQVK